MAFIGNTPTTQAFTPAVDYFSGNGSTTAFTLSRPVASVAQVQVVIDNVAQNPSSAYTISGSTITFTSAPLAGTNNIYVYYTSPITQVIAPGQGTVTATSMASSTGTGAGVFQTSPTITTPTINQLTSASATNLTLQSAGTTAVTIDTSQNVGIGATPNAWGSGTYALQLGNGGIWKSGSRSVDWLVNGYYNGTNYIYNTSNAATYYRQYDGQHIWANAPSGTAGNAITFTQAMTLDSSGRVQINTTNSGRFSVASIAGDSQCAYFYSATGVNNDVISCQNTATSGDNRFVVFYTEVSPTARGNITYNRASNVTAYNTTSDQRLKENIVFAPSAFNKINSIKIRSFDWKENKSHTDFGVIAQELHLVAPEAVTKGVDKDDGSVDTHWAVDTSTLVPMLIKAIQELKALVDAQATEIAELKAKVGV